MQLLFIVFFYPEYCVCLELYPLFRDKRIYDMNVNEKCYDRRQLWNLIIFYNGIMHNIFT